MVQKKVVAIHDISCYGRCSLTVALPILSAAGINTPIIPTAVLSTFVGPFPNFTYRDMTEDIIPVVEHWNDMGFEFDAVYTGFLGSKEQVDVVRKAIRMIKNPDTRVYVDPVMGDHGDLYSTFNEDFPAEMAKLCKDADIIIPNFTEATRMLKEPFKTGPYTKEYVEKLIRKTGTLSAGKVVLTGVHFDEKHLGAATYDKETDEIDYIMKERVRGFYHGSGDIFGSGLVSSLVNGWSLSEAVDIAEDLTITSIVNSLEGGYNTDHGLCFEKGLADFGKRVNSLNGHRTVVSDEDVNNLSVMAREIWTEAFGKLLSPEQLEYMLEKFLSPESIKKSVADGITYEFIEFKGEDAGFFAYRREEEKMFLSKIYVRKNLRGKGLASYAVNRVLGICRMAEIDSIYLTVNRGNENAISAYRHWGFSIVKDVDTDIGNGYFMNDHIMELDVKNVL